jgi:hypothetical protein
MASSGIFRRVALVRTEVSEKITASFIRVTRLDELGTMLVTDSVVPSSPTLVTLMKEAQSSSETSLQEPHGATSQKTSFFMLKELTQLQGQFDEAESCWRHYLIADQISTM